MQANEENEMKLIYTKKIKLNKNWIHKGCTNIRDYSLLYYIYWRRIVKFEQFSSKILSRSSLNVFSFKKIF